MRRDKIFSKLKQVSFKKFFSNFFEYKDITKEINDIIEGETIVVEGGPATGKTTKLNELMDKKKLEGNKVFYIDANKTIKEWVKGFNIFGKSSEQRIVFMFSACSDAYLFIDNGEKITDTKIDVILQVIENAKGVVIACNDYRRLNPKLKNRIIDAKLISLGSGIEPLDVTYIVVACLIILMAIVGDISFLFMAAATRYMFHGFRYASKGQRSI